MAKELLSKQASTSSELSFYMIGDSLEADIKGGNSNGFKTILVKTGNYRDGQDMSDSRPEFIVEGVEEAVRKVLQIHDL